MKGGKINYPEDISSTEKQTNKHKIKWPRYFCILALGCDWDRNIMNCYGVNYYKSGYKINIKISSFSVDQQQSTVIKYVWGNDSVHMATTHIRYPKNKLLKCKKYIRKP